MKILDQAQADGLDVPVVPMALSNLWGSYFSRIEPQGAMTKPFRRGAFNTVTLRVGPAMPAQGCTPAQVQAEVAALLDASKH